MTEYRNISITFEVLRQAVWPTCGPSPGPRSPEYPLSSVSRDALVQILECPICLDSLFPPVRFCCNGHSMCPTCHNAMTRCGLCRDELIDGRNFLIERILEISTFSCNFVDQGCPETIKGSERRSHEKQCDYRPILCTIQTESKACVSSLVDYNSYFEHLVRDHKIACMTDKNAPDARFRIHFYDSNIFCRKEGYWPPIYYRYDEQVFIVRSYLANGTFSTWCCVIGTRAKAADYSFHLTMTEAPSSNIADGRDNCDCCTYQMDNMKVSEKWRDRPVFTHQMQTFQDLEACETPFRIKVEELPCFQRHKVCGLKRKRHSCPTRPNLITPELCGNEELYSWSIVFETTRKDGTIPSSQSFVTEEA